MKTNKIKKNKAKKQKQYKKTKKLMILYEKIMNFFK